MASPATPKSKSKSKSKSNRRPNQVRRRLNRKGLAIFGALLALFAIGYFPWKWNAERSVRASALAQSKTSAEKGDIDLAIRHLDRLLADSPDDIPALEEKADLLAKASERSSRWLLEAAKVHDQLIRVDPNGKNRLETRRRLAKLYIDYSDVTRVQMRVWDDPNMEVKELRYGAAAAVAHELIRIEDESKPPIADAAAHRLLAMAYMGQVPNRSAKVVESADPQKVDSKDPVLNARKEFKEALRVDPRDLIASEKLAELYLTQLNDPVAAEKTLDDMLAAMPESVEARKSRYRAFSRSKRPEKAKAELDAAIALQDAAIARASRDPKLRQEEAGLRREVVNLRLQAANDALGRQEPIAAREHLQAIALAKYAHADDLRVKILQGQVEFAEQNPDNAVDQWRQGLSLVGGGDGDLTWHLAYSLIRLGGPRLPDALPLISQYFRLSKDDRNGKGLFLQALYDQRMGHPSDAIAKLERVVNVAPADVLPDAQMTLAACYEGIGDVERAITAYSNAAKAAPTASAPRRAIARMRLARNPEQAVSELERVLNRSRDEGTREDPAVLFDLLRIRLGQQLQLPMERRRWEEVEGLLKRVEGAKKGAIEAATYRALDAEYLVGSNKAGEAVRLLEDAVRDPGPQPDPKDDRLANRKLPANWLALASLLERQNRRADAIKALDAGMAADAAGDHAPLRVAKAQLLANDGKGQDARRVLAEHHEGLPVSERPEVYRALGNLLRNLGDRPGARSSYVEWARLAPESVEPAQTLLNFGDVYGDDEAARLGREALRSGRGMNDPYALAAQALELLRVDRNRPGPPPAERLEQAERLVAELNKIAPSLAWRSFIEGRIQEYRGHLKEAAAWYRKANSVGMGGPALPSLIEVYMRLHADDQLAALEREYEEASRQAPVIAKEFARVSLEVARKLADQERVDYFTARLVDGKAETVQVSAAQATLLDSLGKAAEAEAKLQELVKGHPQEPTAWYTLIRYLKVRRTPAEVAKAIEQARATYRGERPELFLAQCYRLAEDKVNAARAYQAARDKGPEDLVTLRAFADFCESGGQDGLVEEVLKKALGVDPAASWASKALALRLSSNPDPARWLKAWKLIAPGAAGMVDSPDERLVRATVLARCPDSDRRVEAVAAFAALVDDLPIANPLGIDARVRLSKAMLELNRNPEAWTYIAPLADDQSRLNPDALSIGVEALARSGKGEEAQRRLDRLTSLVPQWPQTPFLKGWVLLAKGKKAEASAALKSAFDAAAQAPEGEDIGLKVLDLLVRFGDPEGAHEVARKIADHWPKDAWVLARIQMIRQECEQALASCRVSLAAGGPPEVREAMRQATSAALYRQADKPFLKQVEELGQAALAKAPKEPEIFIFQATVLHMEGRYQDEVAAYYRALELNPINAEFLNNMAWTLSEALGKPEEALQRIEDAIRRVGATPDFLDTRGVIRSRLGRHKEAIADLELSIKGRRLATTYYHLARVHSKAGNLAESRRYRDLAWKEKFDPATLDPTDRVDLAEVMGKAKP